MNTKPEVQLSPWEWCHPTLLQVDVWSSVCLYPCAFACTYVGVPNVEDMFMCSDDHVLIQASCTGLSISFEHEWRCYFCPLDIDANCVSKQCELLASVLAAEWPGISAWPTFGFAKRTAEGGLLGRITRALMLGKSKNIKGLLGKKIFLTFQTSAFATLSRNIVVFVTLYLILQEHFIKRASHDHICCSWRKANLAKMTFCGCLC